VQLAEVHLTLDIPIDQFQLRRVRLLAVEAKGAIDPARSSGDATAERGRLTKKYIDVFPKG